MVTIWRSSVNRGTGTDQACCATDPETCETIYISPAAEAEMFSDDDYFDFGAAYFRELRTDERRTFARILKRHAQQTRLALRNNYSRQRCYRRNKVLRDRHARVNFLRRQKRGYIKICNTTIANSRTKSDRTEDETPARSRRAWHTENQGRAQT